MKVYVTVIPDMDREKDDAHTVRYRKKILSVVRYTMNLIDEDIQTRLVLTNMPRDRSSEFVRASEI